MKTKKVCIVGYDRLIAGLFFEKGYELIADQDCADIVCFIGGADIDPSLYGEKVGPARIYTNKTEDMRDTNAWKKTKLNQFKVGICRGGQFLNAMNGGKMYQHVSGHTKDHDLYDCMFNGVAPITVTSTHHQMMIPQKDAEVLGYSECIGEEFWTSEGKQSPPVFESEVLWYEKTRSLCFQPHPEFSLQNPNIKVNQCKKLFFDLIEVLQ